MQIEKINSNKLKVILDLEDLENNNIDLNSFMSNSLESQELFLDILDLAEKDLNFYTNNSKLIIESISLANNIFIFTITKQNSPKISLASNYIYCFNTFDDIYNVLSYIDINNLFLYNNVYYLISSINNKDNSLLEEFAYKKISSDYIEDILVEHKKND